MTISREYLNEILEYNPETGELKNRINRGRGRAGKIHITLNSSGYVVLNIQGKLCKASRIIWFMMTGAMPYMDIDHKDGNRRNDRWENLRHATRSENLANRKVSKNNQLGLKGVRQRGKRFGAQIKINGALMHLGYYSTAEEAHEAFNEAANIVHGEFAAPV